MAINIFEMFGTINADNKPAKNSIDNIVNYAKNANHTLSNGLEKIGGWATSAGKSLTVGVTAPIVGLGVAATKTITETTAKLQALDSQFTQTFKDNGAEAMKLINEQAEEQGIHVDRLRGTWSSFYGTFRGGGADANQSLELTKKYLEVAGDGAAYYDMRLEEVTSRLKSLTMGNFEAGDAIGVNINATKMDIKAKEQLGKAWNDLTDTEKNYLMIDTVSKIYEASGAMGQGAREADSYENVMGNLTATWERFLEKIGGKVLDGSISSLKTLTEILEVLQQQAERLNFDKLAQFAEGFFPGLSTDINDFSDAVSKAVDWINGMDDASMKMAGSTAAVIVGLGPALTIFGKMTEKGAQLSNFFETVAGGMDGLSVSVGNFPNSMQNSLSKANGGIKGFVANAQSQFNVFKTGLGNIFSGSGNLASKFIPDKALTRLSDFGSKLKNLPTSGIEKVGDKVGQVAFKFDTWAGRFETDGSGIYGKIDTLKSKISSLSPGIQKIGNGAKSLVGQAGGAVTGVVGQTTSALQSVMGMALKFLGPGVLIAGVIAGLGLLDGAFGEQLNGFIQMATTKGPEIINGFVQGITDKLPDLIATGTTILTQLLNVLTVNLPIILSGGVQIIQELIAGLIQGLPNIIPAIIQLVGAIAEAIIVNAPLLLIAGLDLLQGLIDGIIQNLPLIVETITQLLTLFGETLTTNLPIILTKGIEILVSLINGIVEALPQLIPVVIQIIGIIANALISNLPTIIEGGIKILNALINGVVQIIPQLIPMVAKIFAQILGAIISNLPDILQAGIELLGELAAGVIQAIPDIVATIPQIFKEFWDAISSQDWLSIGKNIIDGVANGISNAAGALWEAAKSALGGFKDKVLGFFGIHSPSRWGRDAVGRWIPRGIAGGIEDDAYTMQDALTDAANNLIFDPNFDSGLFDTTNFSAIAGTTGLSYGTGTGNNSTDSTNQLLQIIIEILYQILEKNPDIILDGDSVVDKLKEKISRALDKMNKDAVRDSGLQVRPEGT